MAAVLTAWTAAFLSALQAGWWRWGLAWMLTLVVLIQAFHHAKPRLRSRAVAMDSALAAWARTLRYRAVLDASAEPGERHLLTWYFRFWTNFASAPCLCVLSCALPLLMAWWQSETVMRRWFEPGLCYAGAMLLSYVTKRVFKRLRPERKGGAFGHRLNDPSFPSGHSLTAFCFWFSVLAVCVAGGSQPAIVLPIALAAVFVVSMTGLSRIYMAVHFPSDVMGGYIIGLVWSGACLLALGTIL